MWESILNSFRGLTPMLWVSQIAGFIGLLLIGISYLFKKKIFLLFATISFIFFICEGLFASLWASAVVSIVCFIRNLISLVLVWKKDEELPRWSVFVMLGVMWAGVLLVLGITHSFSSWDSYLPAGIVTMSTFTQNAKNNFIIKIGACLHETGFLVFYLIQNLPLSIFRQILLVVATLVGIGILVVDQIKNKRKIEAIE